MLPTLPWDIHPDLTAERLQFIGGLLLKGRDDALERHEPSIGDNGWTLGCRSYAFSQHQISAAAGSPENPWLKVIDPSSRFVFQIGAVPVRIYSGDAEEPHDRTLRQGLAELRQLSFAFTEKPDLGQLVYRFAIETAFDGTIAQIVFVGTTGTTIGCFWPVPLVRPATVVSVVGEKREEGVELGAPPVGSPADGIKDDADKGAA